MTGEAREALSGCEVIFGYSAYLDLIAREFADKELRASGMRQEVERCREALEEAARGRSVGLVCSGDAGVYGMASPTLELAGEYPGVDVFVVPGVTAAMSGAALLGAPLSHDFAVVSLSDLLTPWEDIERRLDAAARADFCICLYNPSSRKRAGHLRRACDIMLRSKPERTMCGIVRNVGRAGQESRILTLGELRDAPADMFTTVFVGNVRTYSHAGKLVTPRGYELECAALGAARSSILLYGGTSEARELAEWLSARGACEVVYCAATEYGAKLATGLPHVTTHAGPLDAVAKERLLAEHGFSCVVDATHPYATHVSESLRAFAGAHGLDLLRLVRADVSGEGLVMVESAEAAAAHVAARPGNVLVTTGAKELGTFVCGVPDFAERLFARVLPVAESIEAALSLGIPARAVIGMQGPFSTDLNEALMRELDIRMLVTKASGAAGGFPQKVEAARRCGAEVVVIGRPAAEEGLSPDEMKSELERRYGA